MRPHLEYVILKNVSHTHGWMSSHVTTPSEISHLDLIGRNRRTWCLCPQMSLSKQIGKLLTSVQCFLYLYIQLTSLSSHSLWVRWALIKTMKYVGQMMHGESWKGNFALDHPERISFTHILYSTLYDSF